MDTHNRDRTHFSLRVYGVLEDIGASVDMSRQIRERSSIREIFATLHNLPKKSVYIFGSSYEGATTLGMKSDIDNVFVHHNPQVIDGISEGLQGVSLLPIQDDITPPGYVKLQVVSDRNPVFVTDSIEIVAELYKTTRFWFFSLFTDNHKRLVYVLQLQKEYFDEINGPALTSTQESVDVVAALKCCSWPHSEAEWLTRQRLFNWPSDSMINKCKGLGCLYVPVGHPSSEEQLLEWRISFAYQERILVANFNAVQLKCFILLKQMKNYISSHSLKQKSLSSYHCKMCMLYMIENTPVDFWSPSNLTACFASSLWLICLWLESGVFPNYFIRGQNLLDRRVHGANRINLQDVLQKILSDDCHYLLRIPSDDLGQRLQAVSCGKYVCCLEVNYHKQIGMLKLHYDNVINTLKFRNIILKQNYTECVETCLTKLVSAKQNLESTVQVTDHSKKETKKAISLVLPHIDLSIMSNFIAIAKKQRTPEAVLRKYLSLQNWRHISAKSDAFSSWLKQATFLHMIGCYTDSLTILMAMKGFKGFSICGCEPFKTTSYEETTVVDTLSCIQDITTEELLNRFLRPCVPFLPTETDIIPEVLCFEMLRTAGSTSESRNVLCYWYDWAVVDGNFLIIFLKYLNHRQLGMSLEAEDDKQDMDHLIRAVTISHRETALNILGWIHKEDGSIDRAVKYFKESLDVKHDHNAATLHLLSIQSSGDSGFTV